MITRLKNLKQIASDRGFMMMPVMIIGIVLAVAGGALMMFFKTQNQQASRSRILEEMEHLKIKVSMIYSEPTICSSPGVGIVGKALTSISSNAGIQLRYPNTGVNSGVMIQTNGTYGTLQISRVFFATNPQLVATPVTNPPVSKRSYISHLTVEVKDGNSKRQAVIPFYLVVNQGGKIEKCFATTYPKPNFNPPITMEDALCREWQRQWYAEDPLKRIMPANQAYYYAPEHNTCFLGPDRPAAP